MSILVCLVCISFQVTALSFVLFQGNDHIFENNHISNMCQFASDCGAMMTGRDWTWVNMILLLSFVDNFSLFPIFINLIPESQRAELLQETNILYQKTIYEKNQYSFKCNCIIDKRVFVTGKKRHSLGSLIWTLKKIKPRVNCNSFKLSNIFILFMIVSYYSEL